MAGDASDARWWHGPIKRLAATRPVAWLFSHTLHHLDRTLLRVSGGRVSIPELFAGVTVVRLTTTGAKTGKRRTVPVLGFPDGDRWIVIASNWGDDSHPAWYHNLSANPRVDLAVEDEPRPYRARDATAAERPEFWERAVAAYPGFEAYRRRAGDREIPVVVLEPVEAGGTKA